LAEGTGSGGKGAGCYDDAAFVLFFIYNNKKEIKKKIS